MQPALNVQPLTIRRVDDELRQISGEIAWYEEETRKSIGLMLQYRLEIGRRLARAKGLLPHGQFLPWARHEFGWSPRHVQNHLRLAANSRVVSRLEPGISLNMALAAIKKELAEDHKPEAVPEFSLQRIYLVGEVEEGQLDCERLVEELTRIAATFGAPKTKWKARGRH